MPLIYPSAGAIRKGPTPIANHTRKDGWDRYFEGRGRAALNDEESADSVGLGRTNELGFDSLDTAGKMAEIKTKKLELVDLPLETQKQIFSFSNHPDLIALSLVSKGMREIASAHLYRSFHIVFPDDDDPANDYPIDSLASGLDTFVTSDYDYAAHLREITLESLSTGLKGENAYRNYLYDASCGKFMNTLLLLTLRKARALERFKWDIRVELSREVFKALHRIQSLQHLHLRMQAGESIHQNAPPLPSSSTTTSAPPSPYLPTPPPLSHHNSIVFIPPLSISYTPIFASSNKPPQKAVSKANKQDPSNPLPSRTISNFHDLKSLSVLDMDSHEYLEEIKTCLENSSSTLSELKLSFSDFLTGKGRKPPPEIHSDDESDIEDEFGQIVPPPGVIDPSAPTKALKAQEEKKRQDMALEKIFGNESPFSKLSILADTLISDTMLMKEIEKKANDMDAKRVKTFVDFYAKFMNQVKPVPQDTPEIKEAMELIEKATRLYFDAQDAVVDTPETPYGQKSLQGLGNGSPELHSMNVDQPVMSGASAQEAPGLFDSPQIKQKAAVADPGVSNPDDIDVEMPEADDLSLDTENVIDSGERQKLKHPEASEFSFAAVGSISIEEAGPSKPRQADDATQSIPGLHDKPNDFANKMRPSRIDTTGDRRILGQYIRKTRGLTLKTLAIYQIPVKTSILSKSIDLSVLQDITLLSVGPQNSLWIHLDKENKQSPLPLRKVHTDNVSMPFLNLVARLSKLEELYMLERLPKRGVELSTSKTIVTMEHIRKAILKNHASTLKVLVIRNDATVEWDLTVKSVMLLCQTAVNLQELTAGFSSKAMHTLLQSFHGLRALRALHVLIFRTPDNCDFGRSELPRLVIDSVSNYPESKLEYLAFVDTVERLVKRRATPPKTSKGKGKAKAAPKAKDNLPWNLFNNTFQNLGMQETYDWEQSSDDDVENQYGKNGLKIETIPLRPCDVFDVKIFEKEIISGRL